MQVLKRHKRLVLLGVLLVAVIVVSLFVVLLISKPSAKVSVSPTPAPTTPSPTEVSPTPKATTTSVQPTATPTAIPMPPIGTPSPSTGLYPGEVTSYENQTLTSVGTFEEDVAQHPDVAIDGTQYLNEATYSLEITGLVNKTMEYTYADLVDDFTLHEQVATLLCVEGWSVTMLWEGVSITDLLQQAGVSSGATVAIFNASDGYTSALPLDYIEQNNLILAYKVNNVTLPADLGFPLALVAQNQYGYKWVKWVTGIDVSNDTGYLGYWESRGYPNNATVGAGGGLSYVTTVEITGASVVVIIMVIAVCLILLKIKRKWGNDWQPP